jgi:peroxiredoxin Q/BCP
MQLRAGMDAPLFELPDADMEMFNIGSLRGKRNIVLYFYPKDDTPGCTMEANEFSDLDDDFQRLNTLVIGVSRDDCLTHAEFRDKHGLSVLLLADTESAVCKAYGVLYDKEVDGRKVKAVQRSTFIIDRQCKVRQALYGVHAHGHPREILNLLKEMK